MNRMRTSKGSAILRVVDLLWCFDEVSIRKVETWRTSVGAGAGVPPLIYMIALPAPYTFEN